MGTSKTILAPTDFFDISANEVLYACRLARDLGAELIIFNVLVLDENNAVSKREMEQHKNGSGILSPIRLPMRAQG
jgi:nucleotide-binding universal stress UspA family protein